MDMPSSITPNACDDKKIAEKEKWELVDVPPSPNTCDDEKEDWVEIPCPCGKEGCEVLHMVKGSPPISPLKSPPPPNKQNEGINPIDPDEIQSIDTIHDMIFVRGKASTNQCYCVSSLIFSPLLLVSIVWRCVRAAKLIAARNMTCVTYP